MNTRSPKYLRFADVPLRVSEEIADTLADHSVALARAADAGASKFEIFAGGALVRRGDRFGVLTARHCAAAAGDSLLLVLKRSHRVLIPAKYIVKHLLGVPWENDMEPDLAFVEILPGPQLQAIKKLASFWPLDEDPARIGEEFGKAGRPFTVIGFQEGVHRVTSASGADEKMIKSMAFFYGIGPRSISERDGWDYLEAQNVYGGKNEPKVFKGINSGPVWGLQIVKDPRTREYHLKNFTLVGIVFLSARITKSRVLTRSHFIKSIYDRAWRKKLK